MEYIGYFEEKDRSQWEAYVQNNILSSNGHLLGWRNAIEKTYPVVGHYLIAKQDDKIVGLLPLIWVKSKYISNELTSLPYISYSGLLGDNVLIKSKLLDRAMKLVDELGACRLAIRQTEYLPSESIKKYNTILEDQKIRMVLTLNPDSQILFNTFKSKLRSQIRRPEKEGMTFCMGGAELINDFYHVFSRNMRDLGSPVHAKNLFVNLFSELSDHLRVGCVYKDKIPVATGIILLHNNTIEIPWASSDRRYNRFSPNMLLYWSFIKFGCDHGFEHFDFGRSSRDEGTHKFKMQWGSVEMPYYWYNIYNSEPAQSTLPQANKRKIIEKTWSKLPLPLANYLGSKIRGYIPL